jgi:stalled ribosome rescue protein Dom34
MISYDDLRELKQYASGADSLVLSLYVSVDQSDAANLNRGFETRVENLLREIAEREAVRDDGEPERFEAERRRVLRFLSQYTPKGKGLVIFSDSARDFWWQRDLQAAVPNEARWSPQPWIRPLVELVEGQDRLGVVLIDKQRAKIFTFDSGGLVQRGEFLSDTPNKHHTTGTDHIWSQGQMERDHLKHIKWHVKQVADELGALTAAEKLTKLVIGGPVEATALFSAELPKRFQQMIIGVISVPVEISADRLAAELRSVREKAEHEDEVKLVDSLITSARKGGPAVLGLSETLAAARQGRIYRLVVSKNFRARGHQCTLCQALTVDEVTKCSYCGGKLEPAPDLINRLSHCVLEQSGRVQAVSNEAAEKLSTAGGIGAILRF